MSTVDTPSCFTDHAYHLSDLATREASGFGEILPPEQRALCSGAGGQNATAHHPLGDCHCCPLGASFGVSAPEPVFPISVIHTL